VDPADVISKARDAMSVQRVYGDPYERNGVTVIPAAAEEKVAVPMARPDRAPAAASASRPSRPVCM
jgi:hypothetical protein